MFDSVLFRRQTIGPDKDLIDIGSLVEAMLFYGTTNVVADRELLGYLLERLGPDLFIELVSEGLLTARYTETSNGIRTAKDQFGRELHDPVIISSPQHTFPDELRAICIRVAGKDGKGRRLARRIEPLINVIRHDPITAKGTVDSILDGRYLPTAATHVLRALLPSAPLQDLRLSAERVGDRLWVHSNIDFAALNQVYHVSVPASHSSLTMAFILNHLFDAQCDLYFASTHLSEMVARPLTATLLSHKVNYLVERRWASQANLSHFQSVVFSDARAVRAAVTTGKVSVADLAPVLKKAQRFKKWLAGQPYDANLLAEYYRAATEQSIVDKLPGKSTRWALFTGVGLAADAVLTGGIGVAAGVTLGALDAFLVDKVLRGWKPSHFIEEELRPALGRP